MQILQKWKAKLYYLFLVSLLLHNINLINDLFMDVEQKSNKKQTKKR